MPNPTEKLSLHERAYSLLKDMIENGRLAPGQRVLEAQVARAFGISRSPARRALKALCDDRLLKEAAGRGYEVAGKAMPQAVGQRAVLDEIKLPPISRWERIYGQVEQELCARVLFVTVRIVEERLAEYFGVSRTVARDVLARMHSVGLVTKDELGHWVANRVTPEKIHHMYEIRWLLEPEALRQAIPFVPSGYIERARHTIMEALREFPGDDFDMDVVENDLHVTLLSYCPNEEILQALARTRVLFVPTRYLFDPVLHIPLSMIHDALQEHRSIYGLLLKERSVEAAATLHEHLKRADKRWLQRFEGAANMNSPETPPYLIRL